MDTSLDVLILEHHDALVNGITKDAARQIRAYERAPLQQTLSRVGRWLTALRTSIRQNDPVEQNGLLALLQAVMGAARMMISVNFIMMVSRGHLAQEGGMSGGLEA